jgi:hypothetical protein
MKKTLGPLSAALFASIALGTVTVNPDGSWTCTNGCEITTKGPGVIEVCNGGVCVTIVDKNSKGAEPPKPGPETSDK